jgi:ketosteroid isomerase-like protein
MGCTFGRFRQKEREIVEHPNVTLVRRSLAALESGEMPNFGEFLAEDIEWHQIGGTTIKGLQALAAEMSGMGDGVDFELEVHDVVGNDDHVVALVVAHVKADELEITYRTAEVYHVVDGKITERWAMSDDTDAINRFFGQLAQENV